MGILCLPGSLLAIAQPPCSPVVTLSGNITANRILDKDTLYEISGCVQVMNNAVLTIEDGTVIQFVNNSILMILSDGQINAVGTPMSPIIMTAAATAPGFRAPVTNAGLIIVGQAEINESPLALTCSYNHSTGSANNHNSGSLEYVQFHYLNGSSAINYLANALSLVGVGSGTTLEHIQITHSEANGLGIIGGHPVVQNLYVQDVAQSGIYTSFGAVASLTEVLTMHKDCDWTSVSGSYGLWLENNPNTPTATPLSMVTVDQSSFLGPLYCGCSPDVDFRDGIYLTNNAGLDLKNSLVAGYNGAGLYIEDQLSVNNTSTAIQRVKVNYTSFTDNAIDYDYNPGAATWLGNGCGSTIDDWIDGSAITCGQADNQFSSFATDYNTSICSDFCGQNPAFTLGNSSEIDFIEGSVTVRRGAIQPADNFSYITACPAEAVYCQSAPIMHKAISALQVYPNPPGDIARLSFETEKTGTAQIMVRELVTGRVLYQGSISIKEKGQQSVSIPVSGWKEGLYPVQINAGQTLWQGKISIR